MIDDNRKRKKIYLIIGALCIFFIALILLSEVANASTLFPEDRDFSRFPLSRYQLDLYLSSDGSGWFGRRTIGDRIGDAILIIFNGLANIIWFLTLLFSSLSGWLVYEAFSLDYIDRLSVGLAGNMTALWNAFLDAYGTYILLVVMAYVMYVGIIKREVTKAVSACLNFALTMIIGMAFFGNAVIYVDALNDFSREMSNTALEAGTSFLAEDSETEGVALIRELLWDIQVTQPWLILNFGQTDIGTIRYNAILSQPWGSDAREDLVQSEVTVSGNEAMGAGNVFPRVGYTLFLAFFNLIITVFSIYLAGLIIFSQIMFVMFASFLPISLILSMIPTFSNLRKGAILELFNTMMMRLGVTVLAVVTFSISSMVYSFSSTESFVFVLFLQLVCFVGIFFSIGKLLNKFQLQSGEQQSLSKRILGDPAKKFLTMKWAGRGIRRRRERRNMRSQKKNFNPYERDTKEDDSKEPETSSSSNPRRSMASKAGRFAGNVASSRKRLKNLDENLTRGARNLPANAKYGANAVRRGLQKVGNDFKTGAVEAVGQVDNRQNNKRLSNAKKMAERRRLMNYSRALRKGDVLPNGQIRPRLKRNSNNGNMNNEGVKHRTIPKKQVRKLRQARNTTKSFKQFSNTDDLIAHNRPDFTVSNEMLKNKQEVDKRQRLSPKRRIPRSETTQKTSSRTAKLNGEKINLKGESSLRGRGHKK